MKIHFIGIGGIGLSALARHLNKLGHTVVGSDEKKSKIIDKLIGEGIKVTIPQLAENITDDIDLVIFSAAVKESNIELMTSRAKGIKTITRKESLEFILGSTKNYCVAGAHGKSTTTAILSAILQNSSSLIGAESKEFGSNYRFHDSDLFVFEADESDSSFLNSNPYLAIVTNAEPEHMEYYNHDLKAFYGAYEKFLRLAKIRVVNAEDPFLSTLEEQNFIKLYPSRDIKNIEFALKNDEPYTRFELKDLGMFEVWGFGEHIALDASLAILGALNEVGLEEIRKNISRFKGIAKRFDVISKESGHIIIDDYAHHPTEIKATITSVNTYATLKQSKAVTAIWQPHKYSRTLDNLDGFASCFDEAHELIILPVYNVGEEPKAIDFEGLFAKYNPIFADKVRKNGAKIEVIKEDKIIRTLDYGITVGFGAGDITYMLRGVA